MNNNINIIKIIKIILLLVILILNMSSCEKNSTDSNSSVQNNTNYIIYIVDNLLVKINCDTGISTTLCQDPLCGHLNGKKRECPFYCNEGEFTLTENRDIVYYIYKGNMKPQINKYNIKTQTLEKIHETDNLINSFITYKNDLFFSEVISKKDNNGTENYTNIYRITSENKLIQLNKDKVNGCFFITGIKDDRIYFEDNNINIKFNTALDYSDLKETDTTSKADTDKKDVDIERDTEKGIIRISGKDKNGNSILITDKAALYFKKGDYIYYYKCLDEPKFIIEDKKENRKYYATTENKIYRSKYDGSENGVFCDFGENYEPFYVSAYNYKPDTGDYGLIQFIKYGYDEKGNFYTSFYYAVLNFTTGEYKMVT